MNFKAIFLLYYVSFVSLASIHFLWKGINISNLGKPKPVVVVIPSKKSFWNKKCKPVVVEGIPLTSKNVKHFLFQKDFFLSNIFWSKSHDNKSTIFWSKSHDNKSAIFWRNNHDNRLGKFLKNLGKPCTPYRKVVFLVYLPVPMCTSYRGQ